MNVPMNDNERQRHSRSYLLPVEDSEFLLRDELRGIRFALEYSKAELLLREWGIRSTVIVFGSARTPSQEHADAMLTAAKTPEELALAKRRAGLARFYEQARAFGRLVSERGGALKDNGGTRDNVIATGGALRVWIRVRISNSSSRVPKPPGNTASALARMARCILRIAK